MTEEIDIPEAEDTPHISEVRETARCDAEWAHDDEGNVYSVERDHHDGEVYFLHEDAVRGDTEYVQDSGAIRRFFRWLRSPDSPSDYPEADIATHRSIAFLFEAVGYATLMVFAGWIVAENPTDAAVADATIPTVFIFAVTQYLAYRLRLTALRWQVEEAEHRYHDEYAEEVAELKSLVYREVVDEHESERGESE
jgi:hypothetical protein